ncbi:MAG: hypothetical protein AB2L14_18730 [Candidatus Xenobiia bacterium LiM19]
MKLKVQIIVESETYEVPIVEEIACLQVRTKTLNNELKETFQRWYPGSQTREEKEAA